MGMFARNKLPFKRALLKKVPFVKVLLNIVVCVAALSLIGCNDEEMNLKRALYHSKAKTEQVSMKLDEKIQELEELSKHINGLHKEIDPFAMNSVATSEQSIVSEQQQSLEESIQKLDEASEKYRILRAEFANLVTVNKQEQEKIAQSKARIEEQENQIHEMRKIILKTNFDLLEASKRTENVAREKEAIKAQLSMINQAKQRDKDWQQAMNESQTVWN